MHKVESRKTSYRNTFPKQYWLAVNVKPTKEKNNNNLSFQALQIILLK